MKIRYAYEDKHGRITGYAFYLVAAVKLTETSYIHIVVSDEFGVELTSDRQQSGSLL